MADKIKSEIIRIDLTDASYKESHAYIEPTYVNFFFGNNGTGKSTIAKALKSGVGLTYAPGRTVADYLTLVYNQEFIDDNFRSYRNMRGVFTLNAKNAKVQAQIDEATAERTRIRQLSRAAAERQRILLEKRTELNHEFLQECWKRGKSFREEFPGTMEKKGRSDPFTREILAHAPADKDIEELRRMYEAAYSDTAKHYSRFTTISNPAVMETVDGSEILSKPIVNSADTELAVFLRDIGATEWVRQGHDAYAHTADGKCPYCGSVLPNDFEETFIASFDNKYQDNLLLLGEFMARYKKTANELFVPLQSIPTELYPQIDIKPYNDKLALLKATIQANIESIKSKTEDPAMTVTLTSVQPILEELADIINGYNAMIDANNAIVAAGPSMKNECVKAVFGVLAFILKDVISAHKRSEADIQEQLDALEKELNGYKDSIDEIEEQLKTLRGNTVETDTAKDSINKMLRDSGMKGFSLQPKQGVDNVYEVRRPDGTIADNLSEGEKNFIAFLYFYHMVQGSVSADGETREKIVVIDDPVSSMDSNALFIVSSIVRGMIGVCYNNTEYRKPDVKGDYIKQIFILTHNAYFHNEITYKEVPHYRSTSFFVIRKSDNRSAIIPCVKAGKTIGEKENYNPVQNSYAALWDELKKLYEEENSSIAIKNVSRRILDQYFLQLCGFDGADIRRTVLETNKHRFVTEEGGKPNYEKYHLASALLHYVGSPSGIGDEMFIDDECLSSECHKAVFKLIFEAMEQDQHYKMMMGEV